MPSSLLVARGREPKLARSRPPPAPANRRTGERAPRTDRPGEAGGLPPPGVTELCTSRRGPREISARGAPTGQGPEHPLGRRSFPPPQSGRLEAQEAYDSPGGRAISFPPPVPGQTGGDEPRAGYNAAMETLPILLSLALGSGAWGEAWPDPAARGPGTTVLELAGPIRRWDEAIPLGNGLLGGLLWGQDRQIRISLDRGDLWDLRTPEPLKAEDWTYATMRKLVVAKDQAKLVAMFDRPYNAYAYPTKIPAGRLELTIGKAHKARAFRLDFRRAVGRVDCGSASIDVFYSATRAVAIARVTSTTVDYRILAPAALKKLSSPPAVMGDDGPTRWYLQSAALGLKYAGVVSSRTRGDAVEIAWTVASTKDGPDPLAVGRKRVADALADGYDALLAPHRTWWERFWSRSGVRVPDAAVQRHYDLVQYFYGAASRRGAPPMPLQGVWTADAGGLPPWKGDYHHDLNTQFTYYAYQAAGRFDQGACFLDFMWDHLPAHRKFARRFYGTPGAAVPGVMTLDGKAMGGWGQYSLSPAMGPWVAHLFYLHWRYTMDRQFLRDRAYPYCSAIAECLDALLQAGPDGKRKLPLSTSPEIHNNSLAAWLTPNTNHDLALLRWLFGALGSMADALDKPRDAARWRAVLGQLDEWAVEGEAGALKLSADESLTQSHRHHAHLMAIHPLGILHVEGTDRDRRIIDASLAQVRRLGTRAWCGYSFSWMACMEARCGRAQAAENRLAIYLEAFLSRNGFHINGDQTKKGYSGFRYRPFTLEGNFAASQAVHEMLLQSWGGTLRVFPATPAKWKDVSFADLRAEGAYRVSAERRGGRTVRVRITAGRDGRLRLRDPFGDQEATWSRPMKRVGENYEGTLRAGDVLDASLKRPGRRGP